VRRAHSPYSTTARREINYLTALVLFLKKVIVALGK
jgi:hypothetical protein